MYRCIHWFARGFVVDITGTQRVSCKSPISWKFIAQLPRYFFKCALLEGRNEESNYANDFLHCRFDLTNYIASCMFLLSSMRVTLMFGVNLSIPSIVGVSYSTQVHVPEEETNSTDDWEQKGSSCTLRCLYIAGSVLILALNSQSNLKSVVLLKQHSLMQIATVKPLGFISCPENNSML